MRKNVEDDPNQNYVIQVTRGVWHYTKSEAEARKSIL